MTNEAIPTGQDLAKLCRQTIDIVAATGAFIRSELGRVDHNQIEEKGLNSLVSYVDKTAEIRLVEDLGKLLPGSAFLTEEETVAAGSAEWRWIIDPLDGTTNFLHQLPCFAISVALEYQGETVLGVIQEVNRQEMFSAWKSGGAWCNGKVIQVSQTATLGQSLLATGFPYSRYEWLSNQLQALDYLLRHTRGVRRWGAAAVDLAYVACGRYDAFFEYALNPWDIAAGMLIIQEAGGRVTDFRGNADTHDGLEVLATNGQVHAAMLEVLQRPFFSGTLSV